MIINYDYLLNTLSSEQWRRIGTQKRAGVAIPLFSITSTKSIGIGEWPDLKLLIDWCKKTSMSIIQLLPVNDVGFNFRPYDAQSTFALEPMHLALSELEAVDLKPFRNNLKLLKKEFPAGTKRVNCKIKAAKLNLLWKIFESNPPEEISLFQNYCQANAYWLEDYALFKVIKEKNNEMAWEGWSADLKTRDKETLASFKETYYENIIFHKWLQWQIYLQFRKVKDYAEKNQVLLMGDLPFLVSRDSADVWAHQDYFKLHLSSGAPPDMLYAHGQRWGMPPYQWDNIAAHNYDYVVEKLRYAQNFYDLYRIDHVVGIFRVWTIALSEPPENGGLNGTFDPQDGNFWETQGRNVLSTMIKNTSMLACAEDLGTIPACSFKVLEEFGIPGIDVQRWMRDWDKSYAFSDPVLYRKNAIATIASHDMSSLLGWWDYEAGCVDEGLFKRKCLEKNIPFDSLKEKLFNLADSFHGKLRWKNELCDYGIFLKIIGQNESSIREIIDLYRSSIDEKEKFLAFLGIEKEIKEKYPPLFVKRALEKIHASASIFSIQQLSDWLSLDTLFDMDPWDLRINFPGTLNDKNWTIVMPLSLEDMLELPVNSVIKMINEESGRI